MPRWIFQDDTGVVWKLIWRVLSGPYLKHSGTCETWLNIQVNTYWSNNYNSFFHLTSDQPKVGKKPKKCHVSSSALTKNRDFGLLEPRRNSLTSTRCRIHIFLSGQLLEQTSDTKQRTLPQTWFHPAFSKKGNQTVVCRGLMIINRCFPTGSGHTHITTFSNNRMRPQWIKWILTDHGTES